MKTRFRVAACGLVLCTAVLGCSKQKSMEQVPVNHASKALTQTGLSPTEVDGTKRKRHKLNDVKWNGTTTRDAILKIWGPPDRQVGSGVDYWLYELDDGRVVLLVFDSSPQMRLAKADLYGPQEGQHTELFSSFGHTPADPPGAPMKKKRREGHKGGQ